MSNENVHSSQIGLRIRTARKKKGMNQTELANLLGKSLRTIQKYESGEIEVSIAMINEIAKVLECAGVYKRTEEGMKAFDRFVDVIK